MSDSPITLEWDMNGVDVTVDTSELRFARLDIDGYTLTGTMDTGGAWALYEEVEAKLGDWYREGQAQRAAYNRATPEERAAVLGLEPPDSGYDPLDPKSPNYAENLRDLGDAARKREKGE